MAELSDLRERVRARYATLARAATSCPAATCCGTAPPGTSPADASGAFGSALYAAANVGGVPASALAASLGCGVPTAVADLKEGETILDLGSGAGADVLISAKRVGPTGKAIGLDMTEEMLDRARINAAEAGVANVEFVKGYLEQIPLPDESVDVVISNCVINLAADKPTVIGEAARVLRPGGRFAVSDVIADPALSDTARAEIAAWTGCIAGALTEIEFRSALTDAGFEDIEITQTHAVHPHAAAAIIRATKPLASACCALASLAECCEPAAKDECCGPSHESAKRTCGCRT
jgi:SAM-dependent methyltransferase